MEKLTDSEILARLIYRAYIAPDPNAPLEAEALLPFQAALDLYARTVNQSETTTLLQNALLHAPAAACETCGDACPITFSEPEPDTEQPSAVSDPDTEAAGKLDSFEPEPLRAHDTHTHTAAGTNDGGGLAPGRFTGNGAGEKREIYARLMAFCAANGLGARRKIAETSNGALTLSDVQDMTDAKRVPLPKWRLAAAVMDQIEEKEKME